MGRAVDHDGEEEGQEGRGGHEVAGQEPGGPEVEAVEGDHAAQVEADDDRQRALPHLQLLALRDDQSRRPEGDGRGDGDHPRAVADGVGDGQHRHQVLGQHDRYAAEVAAEVTGERLGSAAHGHQVTELGHVEDQPGRGDRHARRAEGQHARQPWLQLAALVETRQQVGQAGGRDQEGGVVAYPEAQAEQRAETERASPGPELPRAGQEGERHAGRHQRVEAGLEAVHRVRHHHRAGEPEGGGDRAGGFRAGAAGEGPPAEPIEQVGGAAGRHQLQELGEEHPQQSVAPDEGIDQGPHGGGQRLGAVGRHLPAGHAQPVPEAEVAAHGEHEVAVLGRPLREQAPLGHRRVAALEERGDAHEEPHREEDDQQRSQSHARP